MMSGHKRALCINHQAFDNITVLSVQVGIPHPTHLQVNGRSLILQTYQLTLQRPMSKTTLTKEIQKELTKLNDRIDRKIIKGQPFRDEARRHKELLATLARITVEDAAEARVIRRPARRISKSPVRRSLAGGAIRRMLGFTFA